MRLSGFRINSETARTALRPALSFAIAALFATAASVLAFATPGLAWADYSNPSVSTVAQMRTDGSLHVVEQRSYAFGEDYAAVTWPFTGITDKQEVAVASVRIIQMDAEGNIVRDWDQVREVPFQTAWRDFVKETGGTAKAVADAERRMAGAGSSSEDVELPRGDAFSFDKRRGMLYVFLDSTEDSTVIECDYAIANAALVYDDTAEMYWDYAPAQPDVAMENLRTQIQLPVPDGVEVVPGETVRAWGHGPEGTVEVRADGTVHYAVPEVRAGQYAQAHVLFPRSWLTNITVQSKLAKSGTRFDDALAEEAAWTDTYTWGLVNSYSLNLALHVLCILALLGAVAAYGLWGRERRPEGSPESCARELDAVDAAVVGRLLRWDQHSAKDFVATVRQLERRGVVSVSTEGAEPGDVRFRITPSAKDAPLSAVEQGAMKLLFDEAGDGYQSVSLGDVQRFCREHPGRAREAMAKWQAVLTEQVRAERLFDRRSKKASRWLYGVGAAFAVLAVLGVAGSQNLAMAGALLATGGVVAAIGYCMPRRTPRGVELAECAEAREREAGEHGAGEREAGDVGAAWETTLCNAFGDALVA